MCSDCLWHQREGLLFNYYLQVWHEESDFCELVLRLEFVEADEDESDPLRRLLLYDQLVAAAEVLSGAKG